MGQVWNKIDANLVSWNIANWVEIFWVTWTLVWWTSMWSWTFKANTQSISDWSKTIYYKKVWKIIYLWSVYSPNSHFAVWETTSRCSASASRICSLLWETLVGTMCSNDWVDSGNGVIYWSWSDWVTTTSDWNQLLAFEVA